MISPLATRLAHEVLGRTTDEMPPQTRKLLLLIQAMVREMSERQQCQPGEVRFTRRDIRASTGWSDSQLKTTVCAWWKWNTCCCMAGAGATCCTMSCCGMVTTHRLRTCAVCRMWKG